MKIIKESLSGIVQRVTHHSSDSGWSVLKIQPFNSPGGLETVIVHQTKVFAGATMEFAGGWTVHPHYGRQFKADLAVEKKPATAAALEKYLGSGLIKGVGPKTARKIVNHFRGSTLDIFENDIDRLLEVSGIARKKLTMIKEAWREHRAVREVMMFLQGHGISTLFAVRIYKKYGDRAIEIVSADPYRLALDFYGIGFFSADKVALSIGLAPDGPQRIVAAIRHVLAASREQGHCYLTAGQIGERIKELIEIDLGERLFEFLETMQAENHLRLRVLVGEDGGGKSCYYSKTLYYDELAVAEKIRAMAAFTGPDQEKEKLQNCVGRWLSRYCQTEQLELSQEQIEAVRGVALERFSILTGGPGCGKTTVTLVIVRLLEALGRKVLLAAPTGRAAQRMMEVTGREAMTIHRLLGWQGSGFQKTAEHPLDCDFLIVDESSMLDISLTAALLAAVPQGCQVLFIGDANQLPSVGAGNVLRDIIAAQAVPCFRLTLIFRQAGESLIVKYAHQINNGLIPHIDSPFKKPEIWRDGTDCMFFDADEATREQLDFIKRVKNFFAWQTADFAESCEENPFEFRTEEAISSSYEQDFVIPVKFQHVDLEKVREAGGRSEELKAVLKKIHPWSALHFNITAVQAVIKLYREWIPKYLGEAREIQILSPMTRGSLGTANLNKVIQAAVNPPGPGKAQLQIGERIFRRGDRVIHRRNNYNLNVFNGDIGVISEIDNENLTCVITFFPDKRRVTYQKDDIVELDLAYAITIHKSQGSEFEVVIIPVLTQHFKMLYRNLIYTGLTRARKLAVFVGSRKALGLAVRQQDSSQRQTALRQLLNKSV